jgi:flagellum-specific ATP synthase
MRDIVSEEHWELAQTVRNLVGTYNENYDYVQIGSYQAGVNPTLDAAITLMPKIEAYLKQGINERSTLERALEGLKALFRGDRPERPTPPQRASA